jgi:hypothetical protein
MFFGGSETIEAKPECLPKVRFDGLSSMPLVGKIALLNRARSEKTVEHSEQKHNQPAVEKVAPRRNSQPPTVE